MLVPNTTRYSDRGLTPRAAYTYRVRGIGLDGASGWSNEATGTPLPPPPAMPGFLTVRAIPRLPGQLELTWTDTSNNETAFVLFRKSGSDWVKIATLSPNVTEYIDRGLAHDTSHTYRARAINQGGVSGWSNESTGRTLPLPPSAPAGLTVSTAPGRLELAWTDTSSTETAMVIYRRVGGDWWHEHAVLGPNITRYTDTAVSEELQYSYFVLARNLGGLSARSNEVSVTTPLNPPTGLVVRNGSPSLTYLEWTDNSRVETRYELYRRREDGEWVLLALLPADRSAYLDFMVAAGTTYSYRVRAVGSTGPSGWSNEVQWRVPG